MLHSCMTGTLGMNSGLMTCISCGAMKARPSIEGHTRHDVSLMNLRNTLIPLSWSSATLARIGWATLFIVPAIIVCPITVHLLPCE